MGLCLKLSLQPALYSTADYIVCVGVRLFLIQGGTVYQPVTVVTPQGQVVTQALSPGTIRVQNNQVVHLCDCSEHVDKLCDCEALFLLQHLLFGKKHFVISNTVC